MSSPSAQPRADTPHGPLAELPFAQGWPSIPRSAVHGLLGTATLTQLGFRARAKAWTPAVVRERGTVADLLHLRMQDRIRVVADPAELS